MRTLQDACNLALFCSITRGVGNDNLHAVAIQSVACVALMHKYIAIQSLALHIHSPRRGHIYHTLVVRHTTATQVVLPAPLHLDMALFEQGVENMFCDVAPIAVGTARCGSKIFECKPLVGHLAKCVYDKSRTVVK